MVENRIQMDFVPDKKILRTISKTKASFKDSFSELIDNSLDSFKSVEEKLETDFVTVSIQFNMEGQEGIFKYKNKKNEDYDIEIWDNAGGMTKEEFKKCLKLGYTTENHNTNSIKRYGVGLKTSLLSLGNKFKIMTRPVGAKEIYSISYDDEKFVNDNTLNWDSLYFTVEEPDLNFPKHGTIIKIKKRKDLSIYSSKISQMKSYFKIQYAQFLKDSEGSKKELLLKVNLDEIEPEPLDLINFNNQKRHKFYFKLSSGKTISGWYGFYSKGAKKGQVKGYYGFDLIWQRRIIERYSKVGIKIHPEFQRIYGEIHLDELDVDFHKTSFIEDTSDFVEFEKHMEYFMGNLVSAEVLKSFSVINGKTKTQLFDEEKQFIDSKLFFEYIKRSRNLRSRINKIRKNIQSKDILPISLEELKDIERKLLDETISLDNVPVQEQIISKVEEDLFNQRKIMAEEAKKDELEDQEQQSQEGDKEEEKDNPKDSTKYFYFKFADADNFDIQMRLEQNGEIIFKNKDNKIIDLTNY